MTLSLACLFLDPLPCPLLALLILWGTVPANYNFPGFLSLQDRLGWGTGHWQEIGGREEERRQGISALNFGSSDISVASALASSPSFMSQLPSNLLYGSEVASELVLSGLGMGVPSYYFFLN